MKPYVSMVIPVHNEAEVLDKLFERLFLVLEALQKPYEVIFTNDGSQDASAEMLAACHRQRPEHVSVITFKP